MKRIVLHWTAGGNKVSGLDKEHYHFIVDGDAVVHPGNKKPEANRNTSDGDYVAHTRGLNTASIGISMAGMAGAREHPFDPGKSPINVKQLAAFVDLAADLAETYNIPVTRETILMHSEVQPTLGVKQRGKWDLNWLPGMPAPGDPIKVGDTIREMIGKRMGVASVSIAEGLRYGDRGARVKALQDVLTNKGYHLGEIDGHFGTLTRAAVLAFQADNGLETSGVATDETFNRLEAVDERPLVAARKDVTVADVREKGSSTIANADKGQAALGIGGVALVAKEVIGGVDDAQAAVQGAEGLLGTLQGMLLTYWPVLLVIAVVAVGWHFLTQIKEGRAESDRNGRHIGR